jgi:hypothetical protein
VTTKYPIAFSGESVCHCHRSTTAPMANVINMAPVTAPRIAKGNLPQEAPPTLSGRNVLGRWLETCDRVCCVSGDKTAADLAKVRTGAEWLAAIRAKPLRAAHLVTPWCRAWETKSPPWGLTRAGLPVTLPRQLTLDEGFVGRDDYSTL